MAVCVMGRVCVFLYTGIIFNTHAVVGALCVWCGGVSSFVVGLLFSTRVVSGVRVLWGGAWLSIFFAGIIFNTRAVVGYVVVCGVVKFPLLLWVYFFLPVS